MVALQKSPFRNLFEGFFNDLPDLVSETSFKSKIISEENDYIIGIPVPGLTKDDIKITFENNVLRVEHESPPESNKFNFVSSFTKTYYIPEDVDEKSIAGSVENGVLRIHLPKNKKKSSVRLITVN